MSESVDIETLKRLLAVQSAKFDTQQAEISALKTRLDGIRREEEEEDDEEESAEVGMFKKQFHSGHSSRCRGGFIERTESVKKLSDAVERNTNSIKLALESPSIYILKSVRGLGSQGTLSILVWVVFYIQTLFPLWFLVNMCVRKNPTLIAPGFHKRIKYKEPTRERLLHYFAVELSSAVFLLYIAWSAWNRRSFETLAFFMNSRSKNLRRYVLYLGYASQITTIFSVVLMTYVLVRLEPRPHQLLLNAVALNYLVTLDINVVEAFHGDLSLVKLLRGARDKLAVIADEMNYGGAIIKISRIARESTCTLLTAKRDESTHYRGIELIQRLVRELYMFVVFALLVLSATGGHVAHSHIANILWVVHIEEDRPARNKDVDRYPFNRIINAADSKSQKNRDRHPDRKYIPMAAIIITGSYLCICAAGCFFKARRKKQRRARRKREEEMFVEGENVVNNEEVDEDKFAKDNVA